MLICWLRYSRFRQTVALGFLTGQYRDVQRELAYARRISREGLPAPHRKAGRFTLTTATSPCSRLAATSSMPCATGATRTTARLTIVLVDVTGHGIAAALAVNRLHGEVKRALAQRASAHPGQILTALNEYVHLTLADEKRLRHGTGGAARSGTNASCDGPVAVIRRRSCDGRTVASTCSIRPPSFWDLWTPVSLMPVRPARRWRKATS
jgi:hypothetical protein